MLKTAFQFFAVFTVFAVQNSCFAQISTFSGIPANSPPNFGSVSSVSSFPNAFSSASATSGDFWQPTFSFPPGNTFSSSSASANASASSQASTIPSSLDTFISTFTKAIHSSTVLSDAFDISQTSPQSYSDFVYHVIHEHLMSNGISNPREIATFAAQPIRESFEVLTVPMLVWIDANAVGDFWQPTFSFPPGNTFSSSSASANPGDASSQASTIPSSLDTFISTFTKAIYSSTVLSDAFDISQTSLQSFADFVYHVIYEHLMSNGISDPRDIATYAAQPIRESFEVLTVPMLVWIDANAVGKYLLDEGILNDMNAASLASAFAKEMETSAKRTVEKSFQDSKFQAMADGYIGFLKAQGLYTREKLPMAAKYFGKEVRLAAENFGRKRSL